MKNLIRASLLTAAVALTALLPARAVTLGTCDTTCRTPGVLKGTHVYWSATQGQCCDMTGAPCPAGSFPSNSTYYYPFPGSGYYICPL
jgi:hypothetical protein